jgi:hypothetical protein
MRMSESFRCIPPFSKPVPRCTLHVALRRSRGFADNVAFGRLTCAHRWRPRPRTLCDSTRRRQTPSRLQCRQLLAWPCHVDVLAGTTHGVALASHGRMNDVVVHPIEPVLVDAIDIRGPFESHAGTSSTPPGCWRLRRLRLAWLGVFGVPPLRLLGAARSGVTGAIQWLVQFGRDHDGRSADGHCCICDVAPRHVCAGWSISAWCSRLPARLALPRVHTGPRGQGCVLPRDVRLGVRGSGRGGVSRHLAEALE